MFVLNAESGELRFGDGAHGARLPDGAIIRAAYEYGGGREGNVGAKVINTTPAVLPGFVVENPIATWGGADAETVVEGEKQIARYLQHRDRLVTADDFRVITLRTPGVSVGRVEVLPTYHPDFGGAEVPGVVTLLLIPTFDPLQPDAPLPRKPFLDAVCRHLDPRRLVTTEVVLRGPDYKGVWISIGIKVAAGYNESEVTEAVAAAIRAFLAPTAGSTQVLPDDPSVLLGGITTSDNGWKLGKGVVAMELAAVAESHTRRRVRAGRRDPRRDHRRRGVAGRDDRFAAAARARHPGDEWIADAARRAAQRHRVGWHHRRALGRPGAGHSRGVRVMDVNGTRFHLLLGRNDFGRRCSTRAASGTIVPLEDEFRASAEGADAAFSWETPRAELTLGKRVFYFTPAPGNIPVSLDNRRGAAFDVHGNVYWISEGGVEILVDSSGSRRTSHFWSSLDDPRDPRCLRGAGRWIRADPVRHATASDRIFAASPSRHSITSSSAPSTRQVCWCSTCIAAASRGSSCGRRRFRSNRSISRRRLAAECWCSTARTAACGDSIRRWASSL